MRGESINGDNENNDAVEGKLDKVVSLKSFVVSNELKSI